MREPVKFRKRAVSLGYTNYIMRRIPRTTTKEAEFTYVNK